MVGFKSKYLFRIKKKEKIRYIAVNISNIFYFFIFPFLLFKNEKKNRFTLAKLLTIQFLKIKIL